VDTGVNITHCHVMLCWWVSGCSDHRSEAEDVWRGMCTAHLLTDAPAIRWLHKDALWELAPHPNEYEEGREGKTTPP